VGKYDDLLADLPPAVNASGQMNTSASGGRFDDLLNDLPPPVSQSSESFPLNPLRTAMYAAGKVSDLAPWNKVSKVFPAMAGGVAKEYTSMGLDPRISALLATPLAIAPQIAGTALSLEGLHNAPSPTVRGLVNTPAELGPEYEAQNTAIGITRRVPQEGGAVAKFPQPEFQGFGAKQPRPVVPAEPLPSIIPIRYPSKPGDFMAYANNRLQFGTQLDPQELMDWQVKLQTDMGNGAIPKIDPSTGKITTIFQQASDLKNRIQQTFNKIAEPRLVGADLPEGTMPTRAGLNQAYGIAAKQAALQNALKKAAEWTVGGGSAGYTGYELLKNLLHRANSNQ